MTGWGTWQVASELKGMEIDKATLKIESKGSCKAVSVRDSIVSLVFFVGALAQQAH